MLNIYNVNKFIKIFIYFIENFHSFNKLIKYKLLILLIALKLFGTSKLGRLYHQIDGMAGKFLNVQQISKMKKKQSRIIIYMALLQFPEDERTDAVGEATLVCILQPMDTIFLQLCRTCQKTLRSRKKLGVQDVTQARFICLDSVAW